jgi:nucleoside-diphosphate-sugar epimerase
MRLLILGGTVLLGRAVARHARAAGHDVTCAARGVSGQPVDGVTFATVDRDRSDGLAALGDAAFDAVVDVSGRPGHVRAAVAALAERVPHWVYVSSGSVYADRETPYQRADSAPVVDPAPAEAEDSDDASWYGPCKRSCELAVLDGVGDDRAFICRAGLIVGPEDGSGRFTYWVERVARSGEVLAPGTPEDLVQWVDVRDLAAWLVAAAETRLAGVYDGIGAPVPRGEFLAAVARGLGTVPTFTWVHQDFLAAHGIRPWAGERSLPMWLPLPEYAGFLSRDVGPALDAGLSTRDVGDTARDTYVWLRRLSDAEWAEVSQPGITPEEEARLLAEHDNAG